MAKAAQNVKEKSLISTLHKRLFSGLSGKMRKWMINDACAYFVQQNPAIDSIAKLRLPGALETTLDKLFIDIELQRELSITHLLGIIYNFDGLRWKPITLWKDPDNPGKFGCIDGQHSALALYAIVTIIFGLDPRKVRVPYILSQAKTKDEALTVFLGGNTSDSKSLTAGDIWNIVVVAVRKYGNKQSDFVAIEAKQTVLEKFGLHVADKESERGKFRGAITRAGNQLNDVSIVAVEYFGRYWKKLNQDRTTEPKELILLTFFQLFVADEIKLTVKDINTLTTAFEDKFGADFGPDGEFWRQCDKLYQSHRKQNPGAKLDSFSKEAKHGITYLLAIAGNVLEKDMPEYNTKFEISAGDL